MKCIYCNKEFTPRVRKQKTCGGTECKRMLCREASRIYHQNMAIEAKKEKEKKKKNGLADMARKARECGMTYGQYVASMGKEQA